MQGRAQAAKGGAAPSKGGRRTPPQQNRVVKNLKLDFFETDRRGYVQTRADSVLREQWGSLSATQRGLSRRPHPRPDARGSGNGRQGAPARALRSPQPLTPSRSPRRASLGAA